MGAWVGPPTQFLGNLTSQFFGRGAKVETLTPHNSPKLGLGTPNVFPWGYPHPISVPNFGLLHQRVGEGEYFENSQICQLELQEQNGGAPHGNLVLDIDLFLVPAFMACHADTP